MTQAYVKKIVKSYAADNGITYQAALHQVETMMYFECQSITKCWCSENPTIVADWVSALKKLLPIHMLVSHVSTPFWFKAFCYNGKLNIALVHTLSGGLHNEQGSIELVTPLWYIETYGKHKSIEATFNDPARGTDGVILPGASYETETEDGAAVLMYNKEAARKPYNPEDFFSKGNAGVTVMFDGHILTSGQGIGIIDLRTVVKTYVHLANTANSLRDVYDVQNLSFCEELLRYSEGITEVNADDFIVGNLSYKLSAEAYILGDEEYKKEQAKSRAKETLLAR